MVNHQFDAVNACLNSPFTIGKEKNIPKQKHAPKCTQMTQKKMQVPPIPVNGARISCNGGPNPGVRECACEH